MDMYKTDLFPYIEGGALVDRAVTLTMADVRTTRMPDHKGDEQTKFVLHFLESQKGLILNKTNTKAIIELYGRDSDDWAGKRITLYAEKVRAFGKIHDAARVRAPESTEAPPENGTDPLTEVAQEEMGAEVAKSATTPTSPGALLDFVNLHREDPYDALPHLLNALKIELGEGWNWPAANDTEGWVTAKNAALTHKRK